MPYINCDNCNKKIYRQPNQLKNTKHSFCDKKCRSEWQAIHWTGKNAPAYKGRPPKEVVCNQCGKKFLKRLSSIKNNQNIFCSRTCKSAWQRKNKVNQHLKKRVVIQCDNCGKDIERQPSHVNETNFCNRKCFGEWKSRNWVGENSPFRNWADKNLPSTSYNSKIVKCNECGKNLKRPKSQINKSNFCNKACQGQWQSKNKAGENSPRWKGGKVTVNCANCTKPIKRMRFEVEYRSKNFFCDKGCRGEWMSKNNTGQKHPTWKDRIDTACEYCGNSIEVENWRQDRAEMFFCNQECRANWTSENKSGENSPLWKGGRLPYYGPNWQRQRRKARKRDGYTCQKCGMCEEDHIDIYNQKLHVHHIIPFREFGYIQGKNEKHLQANQLSNLITVCQKCHNILEHSILHLPLAP